MTRPRLTRPIVEQHRDDAEERVYEIASRAVKDFLREVVYSARQGIRSGSLRAAAQPIERPSPDQMLTLGGVLGWWAQVTEPVQEQVRQAWLSAYTEHRTGLWVPDDPDALLIPDRTSTSYDAMTRFLSQVRNRITAGGTPNIILPELAFDRVRVTVSRGIVLGWDTEQTARRIAADLSWDKRAAHWQEALNDANRRIDVILDPLGSPGSPAREAARLGDPEVAALQAERSEAISHLEEDESVWQNRAETIARTESTAAYNNGALAALIDEGWSHKEWLATTSDPRTRPSHRKADGQIVRLTSPFKVGTSTLQAPGDPSAPASEVINCRCCVLGADDPDA